MQYRKIFARPAPHIPAGSGSFWLRPAPHIPAGSTGARSSWRRLAALLLTAALLVPALLLTACGSAEGGMAGGAFGSAGASAASMFLYKTEGTVAVADGEGAEVAPAENLGLYSGYTVGTKAESYAWIDLDKVKLAKLDENSAAAITKDGKNLSIDMTSGSLFFNVTEPLANDETMEISTSSLLVGIRGTCGWVAKNTVGLLEGTVTVTAGDESITITAGECAQLAEDGTLEVSKLSPLSIPGFVSRELLDDEVLQQAVLEASGLHIPTSLEEWISVLEQQEPEKEIVHSELIDFQQDGEPELLIIRLWDITHSDSGTSTARFSVAIYQYKPEGIRQNTMIGRAGLLKQLTCLLVESGGKQFVCVMEYPDVNFYYRYIGPGPDGAPRRWGIVDSFKGNLRSGIRQTAPHDEWGFVISGKQESGWETFDGTPNYTFVREIYSISLVSNSSAENSLGTFAYKQ